MLRRTEGIVLRSTPFGEADLIVTYLTQDHGVLRAFAKSPRKVGSRFGSSLEPFTCSNIGFWGKEESSLPRLTQSDIIHSFHSLRSSLDCYLRITEMIELTLHVVPEREFNGEAYSLLTSTLQALEADCRSPLAVLFYKVRLLDISGFSPELERCGRCGTHGDMFYLSEGTVLCGRCSGISKGFVRLPPGVSRLHGNLRSWTLAKLGRIKPSAELVRGLSTVLDEHVRYVLARRLRTAAFPQRA